MPADLSVIKDMLENVAFSHKCGVKIDVFEPRKVVLSMEAQEWFFTPMGTVAAGPIFTLAEMAGAVLLSASLDLTKFSLVAKRLEIQFKRPGQGTLKTELTMTEDEVKKIEADNAAAGGKSDAPVKVDIVGENGKVVAEILGIYQIRKLG
ncbi:MAG: PaaI family thioesterase [bacterium]|nr:PaaI family thioesterase [bacterium]